jgi:hypothetical protein
MQMKEAAMMAEQEVKEEKLRAEVIRPAMAVLLAGEAEELDKVACDWICADAVKRMEVGAGGSEVEGKMAVQAAVAAWRQRLALQAAVTVTSYQGQMEQSVWDTKANQSGVVSGVLAFDPTSLNSDQDSPNNSKLSLWRQQDYRGMPTSRGPTTRQQRPESRDIEMRRNPESRDIEMRRRLAALNALNGWQAVDVAGDGNAFFRALAKQVYLDEQDHGRARQETIQYMRDRREDFEQYVHDEDFDSYVDHMSRKGTYITGELEIRAAANAFNVRINVFGRSEDHDRTFAPLIINSETHDVYMAHYQEAQHYVVLERMDPAPTARGGLSRSMLTSGGLNSSNLSRARRQDSRGTPTARSLPPASARAPGEIDLEMATPLGRPRDELDA